MESLSASRRNQILALLAVVQLMGVLDFSIVNVALPSIQRTFHLAPADLQWVVSAYALMFGGFLLLGGRAADLFDRKRVFMIAGVGIVCTVVTTTIAATAQLGPELQGLAAGLLTTSQQVGGALGTSLASVVATAIALAVGGDPAVAATTGYQATLYLALGLAVITAVLAILAYEPESRSPQWSST
jgi:MFS family permease